MLKTIKTRETKLWALKLIPIIIHNRFDAVYCVADLLGFVTFYLLSKLFRYKIIFEAHSLLHIEAKQISKMKSLIYLILEIFIGKKADAVIALSGLVFDFYRRLNKKTFFIPVFINPIKRSLKKRYKRKIKLIGLIGPFNLFKNRGQLTFLYKNLNKFDKRIRFIIIGKCDNRIIEDRIKYTGYLPRKDYLNLISQLDAVLIPVNFATYGPCNKILEPMALGIPVFTTPEGAVGLDFIKNYRDILIFKEKQLIDMVNKLIFNDKFMERIGLNGYMIAKKYYNSLLYKEKILSIIEKILKNK